MSGSEERRGRAESGFYRRYAPPGDAPAGMQAPAPEWAGESPPEGFESPGMARLNARHRMNWILNAQRLAEDEAAAAGDALRRAADSGDSSGISESVVLSMRAVSTIQQLFRVTHDPLWFHLAGEWERVQGLMHELQVALAGRAGRAAGDEAPGPEGEEVRRLREDIRSGLDDAGARLSEIFINAQDTQGASPRPAPRPQARPQRSPQERAQGSADPGRALA